jgi:hypothetical protein
MTDPYATPESDLSVPVSTSWEVEKIRSGQKYLLYAILLNIGTTVLAFFIPEGVAMLLDFFALGVSILGLATLLQGFRTPIWKRVLLFISMLLPLINLIVLLVLNGRATRELRAAGYHVGLMGASAK